MEFKVKQEVLLRSLSHIQGVIEKRSTLPILSNVLIQVENSKLKFTSTDLDIIFVEEISDIDIKKTGSTTTSASILYDIIRKCNVNSDISIKLISENKLELNSENSKFNLLCLPANDFPLSDENFTEDGFKVGSQTLIKLLNKTKISMSADETRHYLSGVFLHKTKNDESYFLTAAATDSHRLSVSSFKLKDDISFESIILPKKTILQLTSLLNETTEEVKISNNKSKIKFEFKNCILISKVIDGKFPNYDQVIPKNNTKILEINLKDFTKAVDRVVSVSSDKREGVKMNLSKDNVKFSVNSPNSGDGTEVVKAAFNSDEMGASFNSRYLTDVASQVEGEKLLFYLNDSGSPILIKDPNDNDTLFVIMPMKI